MISREMVREYEVVRLSGLVNMVASKAVADLANFLTDDDAHEIRVNYHALMEEAAFTDPELEDIQDEAKWLRDLYYSSDEEYM